MVRRATCTIMLRRLSFRILWAAFAVRLVWLWLDIELPRCEWVCGARCSQRLQVGHRWSAGQIEL